MSNILKVTTPLTERTNLNQPRPDSLQDSNYKIQNPVITDKVVRPDGRNDAAGQTGDQKLLLNYESNFQAFIKGLGKNPEMAGAFGKLLQSGMLFGAEAGAGINMAQEISSFLEMIAVGEGAMAGVMEKQLGAASRFNGPFFELLRKVLSESSSKDLQTEVLNFLKKYTDRTSAPHIQERMKHILQEMTGKMLKVQAQALQEKTDSLFSGENPIPFQGDISRLKEDILPFLNRYITATHDRGSLRELTAQLAQLVARYENGTREGMADSFRKLEGYAVFRKYFGGLEEEQLSMIFDRLEADFQQSTPVNDRMLRLLEMGMNGAAGNEGRETAVQLLRNLLLNESVFMPVLHMVFPMNVDNRMLYSEMWVDPDARGGSGSSGDEKGRAVKALIKFDIQDVGFFDLFLFYCDGKVDMQLNYPEKYRSREKQIRERVSRIFAERGIGFQSFVLGSSSQSIPLAEAFPEIYVRRNTVNVRV